MRQGFRVIDSDRHVNPSLEVLTRYADKELGEHLGEPAPYRKQVKPVAGRVEQSVSHQNTDDT